MTTTLPNFDELWNHNDAAGTEAKFRALLPRAEQSGDSSYHAQLLTQIARTQGLQRKFDDAHLTLDRVEKLLPAIDAPEPQIRHLLERGRVLNSSGKAAEARPLFEQAFEFARSARLDFYAIDAAHMIAIVESAAKLQLEWNLRAMELAENSSDQRARGWLASLYNNIGWSYFEQKQFDEALDVFNKAVQLRARMNQPREHRIARYCVAKTLRHLNRTDQALLINREVHREWEKSGEPDGYIFEELGECLLALGKSEDAKPYFRRAYELLARDEWLVSNEPQRLARLKQLSQ